MDALIDIQAVAAEAFATLSINSPILLHDHERKRSDSRG
jgi:hypothetical protein